MYRAVVWHDNRAIDYIEFTVTDMAAAQAFYGAAFGWEFTPYGPGYAGIRIGEREVGGFLESDSIRPGGPLVVLYSEDLEATLAAVTGPLDAVAEMRAAFDKRRTVVVELLNAMPGVRCVVPKGAFYAFPDVTVAMRQLGIDDAAVQPRQVLSRISHAKNRREGPEVLAANTWNPRDQQIGTLYVMYLKALADANALDFDDLLLKTVELFEQSEHVRVRRAVRRPGSCRRHDRGHAKSLSSQSHSSLFDPHCPGAVVRDYGPVAAQGKVFY